MAIVSNEPCPACQQTGHDKTGNHLVVFQDGGKLCNRTHFHKDGERFYVPPDGESTIVDSEITGKIRYTPDQFRELEKAGRLDSDITRQLALAGMRGEDQWSVMTEVERAQQQEWWDLDLAHFETLKVKDLVARNIHGSIAKLYNVRVGVDDKGKVARYYTPISVAGEVVGAKCRNLPKDFRTGHLGQQFGDHDLFGEHITKQVIDSGRRRLDTLLVVGGELDALAAQEMLLRSQDHSKYKGQLFHVWSVTKGESSAEQLRSRKAAINAFSKIIWCFDNDETGQKLIRDAARLFPGKSMRLQLPSGCKDPNDCLLQGRAVEFVDAWWHPVDVFSGSHIKNVSGLRERLKKARPKTGLSTPWPTLTKYLAGFRPHQIITIGAGSGVGKTEFLREIGKSLIEVHEEPVGVISTEDPYEKVALSYIGKWIDKRIELPPTNDQTSYDYRQVRDYTEEQANAAIDRVADTGLLYFAALDESNKMEVIMEQIQEFMAMGVRHIILDNLTGIDGSQDRETLDENMKTLGRYKDSQPVTIYLVSHLTRPSGTRIPHEQGGEVRQSDFRGSGAIAFWSSYMIGLERNTTADDIDERTTTRVRIVKDRDQGIYNGQLLILMGDEATGRLVEPAQRREMQQAQSAKPKPKASKSKGTTNRDKGDSNPDKDAEPTDY